MLIKGRLDRRHFSPNVHCTEVDITVVDFIAHEGSNIRIIKDVAGID
jgi:hypothetical protein